MEIDAILRLLEQGKSQKEISEVLGVPYGKLRYQIAKHRKEAAVPVTDRAESPEDVDDEQAVHDRYGMDRLVALPRDPNSLYVYWEVTDDRKRMVEEHFHCAWGELPPVLRIYDVNRIHFNGENANRSLDIPIRHDAGNWFVRDLAPDCAYIVDFGTKTLDGRFLTILRSGTVKLPPKEERAYAMSY